MGLGVPRLAGVDPTRLEHTLPSGVVVEESAKKATRVGIEQLRALEEILSKSEEKDRSPVDRIALEHTGGKVQIVARKTLWSLHLEDVEEAVLLLLEAIEDKLSDVWMRLICDERCGEKVGTLGEPAWRWGGYEGRCRGPSGDPTLGGLRKAEGGYRDEDCVSTNSGLEGRSETPTASTDASGSIKGVELTALQKLATYRPDPAKPDME